LKGQRLTPKQTLLLSLFRKYKTAEKELHPLTYLFWECTQRCNLNCLHCGSDCSHDATVADMPAEDFLSTAKRIIDSGITEHPTVVITGGEPLLRKDLPEIGLSLRKMGYRWGIVTNGMALTEDLFMKLLNAGMGAITLSIDGFEANHNWIRRHKNAYNRALQALELITKFDRLESDVVTCVNKRNLDQLDELAILLEKKGLQSWRLFTITPIGRAAAVDDFSLTPSEYERLLQFIVKQKSTDNQLKVNFSCESYLGSYEGKARDGLFFCRAGINIGSILIDGSISACPNIDRKLVQGSIYSDSFADIWQDRFKSFRDRSWTKEGICSSCKEFKYCEGSGLHWWDMESGKLMNCYHHQLINSSN